MFFALATNSKCLLACVSAQKQHRKMPINKELVALDFQRMILLFMEYCLSKQLRPKTMHAYEKTLRLFAKWLQENEEITKADAVKEMHIRRYIL